MRMSVLSASLIFWGLIKVFTGQKPMLTDLTKLSQLICLDSENSAENGLLLCMWHIKMVFKMITSAQDVRRNRETEASYVLQT